MRIQRKYEMVDSVFSFLHPVLLTIGTSILTAFFVGGMADMWLAWVSATFLAMWVLCLVIVHVSIPNQFANEMADLTLRLAMKDRQDPEKDDL